MKAKKTFGIMQMAFTVAGSILGAGYVSGRELWQYFGSFGDKSIPGIVIALGLIALCNLIIVLVATKTNKYTLDDIALRFDIPWLHTVLGILCDVFYYITTIIMIAGIGSLFNQLLGIPKFIGTLIAASVIMFCVYFGINMMVKIFDLTIPVLVIVAILISIARIGITGTSAICLNGSNSNPFLASWFSSALNYACLNAFAGIGIVAPVAEKLENKKYAPLGIIIGGALLLGIALAIILSLSTSPASTEADLPMLDMAGDMGVVFAIIYATLLFIAMIGNGVATMVAVTHHAEVKLPELFTQKRRLLFIIIIGAISLILSMIGFSELVAFAYPIMGYFAILVILLTAEHYIHLCITKKTK